jgi:hypothetical protein
MRHSFAFVVAGICLLAVPTFAGDVTMTNGQTVWKSTQCTAPVIPPVLNGVGSEDTADDVNTRVTQYNAYINLVQAYMNCMSNESQADATHASDAVLTAAQAQIAEVNQRANALGMAIKK